MVYYPAVGKELILAQLFAEPVRRDHSVLGSIASAQAEDKTMRGWMLMHV